MASSGYTAISFVANEQPTTAKWNLIGSNDASFNNGNGFEDGIIIDRHIAAAALKASKLTNPYKFMAWRTAALTAPSTAGELVFDTEDFDTSNNFNTTNGRFTAPVAGFYAFTGAALAALQNNDHVYGGIYVNGVEARRFFENTKLGATNFTDGIAAAPIQLAAGDTVSMYYSAGVAGRSFLVANGGKYLWFGGYLISIT